MGKIVSYRRKLFELASIYKIDKIFDQNLKLTTYEIEIILLKNKVPLPSRRGYLSHVFINKVFIPITQSLEKKFSIIFNVSKYFKSLHQRFTKKLQTIFATIIYFKNIYLKLIKKLSLIFEASKYFLTFTPSKYLKKLYINIENYFIFIISNIVNFSKTLTKTIVESLNNIYKMLKKGGSFRLIVPSLESRINHYNANKDANNFIKNISMGQEKSNKGLIGKLREIFGSSRHLWMYDDKNMYNELQKLSFSKIRKCQFGDSGINVYSEVEDKNRFIHEEGHIEVAYHCIK